MISDPDSESSESPPPAAPFHPNPPPSPPAPVPIFAKDAKDPPSCPGPTMGMIPCAAVAFGLSEGVEAGNCPRSETSGVYIGMTTATADVCHCQCYLQSSCCSDPPRWDPPTSPLPLHLLQPPPPRPAPSPYLAPTSSSPFQLPPRTPDEAPQSARATSAAPLRLRWSVYPIPGCSHGSTSRANGRRGRDYAAA
ncbi:hypothetical protein F5888DRAFT_1648503 [Russula emetica]|nr:hypothetical protein F5888DRAFT_1648503 [Russula emetica]